MVTRGVRALGLGALLGTTCLVAPAQAQDYVAPEPPPIRETIDENGVDLTRGALVARSHSVSIGGPGPMGTSWSRAITSTGSFRDSTAIYLNAGTSTITVTIGARSESFAVSGSNYISNEKTGATLTLSSTTYTFTSREGVVYTFAPWDGDIEQYGGTHRATSIAYPTGERLTFNYEVDFWCIMKEGAQECSGEGTAERLISVEATNGYRLAFEFALASLDGGSKVGAWLRIAKVTAQNMSVDPASQSWPTLTLDGVNSFTDSLNRTTSYTYTSGALTGIKRPGASSNNITIAYTSSKVSSVTNEGVTSNYSYADASGVRTTTIADAAAGDRVVATNLSTMLVTSDTNEVGKKTAYEYYTDSGLLKKVTAPEGNSALFEYDGRGNRTKTTLNPKSGTTTIVTQASYPPSDATLTWKCASGTPAVTCNKPLTTTDALGYVTNYAWDGTTGELTKATLPAPASTAVRPETRYSYSSFYAQYRDATGTLVNFATPVTRLTGISACQVNASCAGTADEVKSTISYGTANVLPVSVSGGSGNGTLTSTTGFSYDSVGNRLTVDGPLTGTADTTRTRFDAARQVIGVVGPDPDGSGALLHRAQRLTYNADGQVTKAESGTVTAQSDTAWTNFSSLEAVDYTYDANARPTTAELSSGTTAYALSQTSYDSLGRVDCTAVRMNTGAYGSLPAACTLGTQGSDGPDRISRMSYDAASRPLSVTTGYGTAAAAVDATVTYADNGKVATVKDGENNLTTYEYDGFDLPMKVRMPVTTKGANASSSTDFEQVTLDANGNVTSHRLRDGQVIAFSYDGLNRVKLKDLPGTEPDVTYTYDNLGRVKSANQSGNNLSFTWDALSRNLSQTAPQGTVNSSWDVAGRRTRLTYPGTGLYVDYNYHVTGEMTKIRENGATLGLGVLATYAYDNLGRRTSVTFGNGAVQAYTFDAVSRLASLSNNLGGTADDLTATFTNNPASQITSTNRTGDPYAWTDAVAVNRNYASNGLNQYTSAGAVSFTYDGRGNLKSDGTSSFSYSSQNQLTGVTAGTSSTSLAYDPAMRLYQVTGPTTTRFAYDGLDAIAEYDASNALLRRYVHGPGIDDPIAWYEGADLVNRRFLSADERGSIISSSDNVGTKLAINSYDEYGIPDGSNTGRFQYTGQMWLPEVGLYHYKARAYSPTLGRFLQTDPIGFEGGMNLYGYVSDDPVNLTDPLGLKTPTISCPPGTIESSYDPVGNTLYCRILGGPDLIVVTGRRPIPDHYGGSREDDANKAAPNGRSLLSDVGRCIADQYGFGDGDTGVDKVFGAGRAASEALAAPVPKELAGFYRHPGSSSVTNVLNALSVKTRIGSRAFFSGNIAKTSNLLFKSARVATVLGRANVITGAAFAVYDAASIGYCAYKKSGN